MSESDNVKVIVALIAAVTSVFVAIVTAILGYLSTRKNQHIQADLATQLEAFRDQLAEKRAERDARRDYQYEARKRLYEQCEPLLFQLIERSEDAHHRLFSLARTARQGHLGTRSNSWLSHEGYYLFSTSYKLFTPIVIVQLVQRLLTLVDLSVDPGINVQYAFAKSLYLSLTGDFALSEKAPQLPYDPKYIRVISGPQMKHPEIDCKQGIVAGQLDNAIEAMIVRETNGHLRCMSYGEFETACQEQDSPVHTLLQVVTNLFYDFHPKIRPVLWRILIAQAHLYEAILRTRDMKLAGKEDGITLDLLKPISQEDRQKLDWRQSTADAPDEEVFIQPFEAAQAYLKERLSTTSVY